MEFSFEITGDPAQTLSTLFVVDAQGHITRFGHWSSHPRDRDVTPDRLRDWTRFDDYILEGFVAYDLRVVEGAASVVIQIRTLGSNRDQHVGPFVGWSLTQMGLPWRQTVPAPP